MHTHPHAHYSSQRRKAIDCNWKRNKRKFACRDLGEDLYSPQYPEKPILRGWAVSVHRLNLTCLFNICAGKSQCTYTDSLFEVDCSSLSFTFSFFFVFRCFYTFFFIFFYTNVWHSKKTEHKYYMSICSNEVEMVIKDNG